MTTFNIALAIIGAVMFFGGLAMAMLSSIDTECEKTGRGTCNE